MAAIDDGTQEVLGQMASAAASADDWLGAVARERRRVHARVRRTARPSRRRSTSRSSPPAHAPLEFRADVHRRFAEMYRDLYADARTHEPDLPELPEVTFRLATGGF